MRRATLAMAVLLLASSAGGDDRGIAGWIARLGAVDFATREEATAHLREAGPEIVPDLQVAWAVAGDPEVRERIRSILDPWGRLPDAPLDARLQLEIERLRGADERERVEALHALRSHGEPGHVLLRHALYSPPGDLEVVEPPQIVTPGMMLRPAFLVTNRDARGFWIPAVTPVFSYHRSFASQPDRSLGEWLPPVGGEARVESDPVRHLEKWLRRSRWIKPGESLTLESEEPARACVMGIYVFDLWSYANAGATSGGVWTSEYGPISYGHATRYGTSRHRGFLCIDMDGNDWQGVTLSAEVTSPCERDRPISVDVRMINGSPDRRSVNRIDVVRSPAWYVILAPDNQVVRSGSAHAAPPPGESWTPPGHTLASAEPVSFEVVEISAGGELRVPVEICVFPELSPGAYRLVMGTYPQGSLPRHDAPQLCSPLVAFDVR